MIRVNLDVESVVPSIIAGLVGGVLAVTFMFSYSAVIFSGELAQFVPRSTGQLLLGGAVIALVMALFSQFKGAVALPQDNPTAIIALIVASFSAAARSDLSPDTIFIQAMIVMGASTAASGLLFYLIGRFKLASLVQFIPYPVIAGFLAGTGWLLVKGSFSVMADVSLDLTNLSPVIETFELWAPGVAFAVIVFVSSLRFSNAFIMPGLILAFVLIFYVVLQVLGITIETAIGQGWLLEPFGGGGLWKPIGLDIFKNVDWKALLTDITGISTILIISIISVLLNLTALQSAFVKDIDINRELRTIGIANLLAAPGGSLTGYHYVSLSTLGHRMKGDSRLVGIVVAGVCLLAMTVGADVLSYVPRMILGGLVMFIGLGFLYDWVYQSFFKLSRADMVVILAIILVIETIGFLEGIAAGIAAASILFIVNYSRTSAIRYSLTGKELHSNIERPTKHRKVLHAQGDRIQYLKLQGYIFFATSSGLSKHIFSQLSDPSRNVSFVILDFQQVTGIDTSAIHEFVKIKQKAAEVGAQLALTHLPKPIDQQFRRERFLDGDAVIEPCFNDADHALEWCEDFILRETGFEPSFGYRSLDDQLKEIFFEPNDRDTFKSSLVVRNFAEEDLLFEARNTEPNLYFVEKGELTIYVKRAGELPYRLRRVGPGSLLGIAGFFATGTRSADIYAQAASGGRAYYLSKDKLSEMSDSHPHIVKALQSFILGVLSERFMSNLNILEILLRAEE